MYSTDDDPCPDCLVSPLNQAIMIFMVTWLIFCRLAFRDDWFEALTIVLFKIRENAVLFVHSVVDYSANAVWSTITSTSIASCLVSAAGPLESNSLQASGHSSAETQAAFSSASDAESMTCPNTDAIATPNHSMLYDVVPSDNKVELPSIDWKTEFLYSLCVHAAVVRAREILERNTLMSSSPEPEQ
ncbi:hypothetical protein BG000_005272 [Podila horticola]|nr:hypothetical protein BG000_005272 [Podila horticola]